MHQVEQRIVHARFDGYVDDDPVEEFIRSVEKHAKRLASSPTDYPDGLITVGLKAPSGGRIKAAFRAYTQLRHLRNKLVVCNEEVIQSAGNILFGLGKYRCMKPGAQFWFHAIHVKWKVDNTCHKFSEADLKKYLAQLDSGSLADDMHTLLCQATDVHSHDALRGRLRHEINTLAEDEREYLAIMKESTEVPECLLATYMQKIDRQRAEGELLQYLVNANLCCR